MEVMDSEGYSGEVDARPGLGRIIVLAEVGEIETWCPQNAALGPSGTATSAWATSGASSGMA